MVQVFNISDSVAVSARLDPAKRQSELKRAETHTGQHVSRGVQTNNRGEDGAQFVTFSLPPPPSLKLIVVL